MLAAARLDGFAERSDDERMADTDRAEALRLKLGSRRDSRRRVPEELRAEAVAFAKAEHASGKRYKSIASALGVKAETLMRWCRASREPKFARIVVKRAARPELTVHGPAGTRIEALSIAQVVELFGALCCSD